MLRFYNPDSIKSAKANFRNAPAGFRYGFIPNLFKEDVYEKLIASFPDVKTFKFIDKPSGGGRKRFYVGPAYDTDKNGGCACNLERIPKIWKDVLEESGSSELVGLLSESTGVNFNYLSMFGFTFGNEGCMQEAHIDGAVRDNPDVLRSPIACLLYFNKSPDNTGGTCIYDKDGKTILFQAPSMRNGLFFFEQHIDAWHGFPVMPVGAERRLVSVAYNMEKEPVTSKNSLAHKITCIPGWKCRVKVLLGRAV